MNKIVPAHNIGGYVPMIDGPEKVSGRAKYSADILAPGQLAGRIYRSPYSHGEIAAIDVTEALKVPGVVAIVTGADCDKTFGVLPVAAASILWRATECATAASRWRRCRRRRRQRARALRRIKLTVRELPAYYTAKAALAPDAVALHEEAGQSRARRAVRTGLHRAGLQ